jgi:prepilin-type N-terminal cleavage/methylation domain-containing protein
VMGRLRHLVMGRLRQQDGFTVVEVMVAALILAVGVMVTMVTFSTSGKFSLVAERHTEMIHTAQNELERVQSLPYSQVALTGTSSSWSSTPTDYTYVNTPSGACPANGSGSAPTYRPDHSSGGSSSTEPLVINGCSYTMTVNGTQTTVSPTTGTIAAVTAWSAPLQNGSTVGGNIYDFVTWTADPSCSQTSTPGSDCDTSKDYKRVTIVVTMNGATQPANPTIVSGFITPPSTGKNPLNGGGTTCTNSQNQTVSCTNNPPPGWTPHQYFLCDTSYSASSCTEPVSGSGNNLNDTLESVGSTAPSPDQLGTTIPTGSNTSGNPAAPAPPCFGLDLGCGTGCNTSCGGLPVQPCTTSCAAGLGCTTNCASSGTPPTYPTTPTPSTPTTPGSAPCYSPPASNSESHAWVTPAIPTGTTWNLTGTGNMTLNLESSTGSTIQATVCLGMYVVPAGTIGSLTGNLLGTPVGAVASADVQATSGVPTPVTFDFNTNSGTTAVVSTGQARVEFVLWIAGSTSPVDVVYDQAGFASQVTFFTS